MHEAQKAQAEADIAQITKQPDASQVKHAEKLKEARDKLAESEAWLARWDEVGNGRPIHPPGPAIKIRCLPSAALVAA